MDNRCDGRHDLDGCRASHENNVIDLEIAVGDAVADWQRDSERVLRLRARLAIERGLLAMTREAAVKAGVDG